MAVVIVMHHGRGLEGRVIRVSYIGQEQYLPNKWNRN
jgi:hypothetical protein